MDNGRLQFQKYLTHQCTKYENITDGKFIFFDKKLPKSSDFYYLEPGLYPSITDIVEAMNTLIQVKDTITAKIASQLKRLEERKRLRFTLQMKGLVLRSLVRIWVTFSEVMLVMNLE